MYITKHAHLSLNILANHFDLNHEFQLDQKTKHLILMHEYINPNITSGDAGTYPVQSTFT
ncbi:unnamed protein product, partial [Rotaria sordida]